MAPAVAARRACGEGLRHERRRRPRRNPGSDRSRPWNSTAGRRVRAAAAPRRQSPPQCAAPSESNTGCRTSGEGLSRADAVAVRRRRDQVEQPRRQCQELRIDRLEVASLSAARWRSGLTIGHYRGRARSVVVLTANVKSRRPPTSPRRSPHSGEEIDRQTIAIRAARAEDRRADWQGRTGRAP